MTIAALPMYDFPALRPATDALWRAIAARLRAAGIEAPSALLRGPPVEQIWTDPTLLLAQTCGYPLISSLKGRVKLVATPRYRAPGCEGAFYRSAVVVRASDPAANLAELRGRVCAVNDAASNSGMNMLRAVIAPFAAGAPRFFAQVVMTGGHAASIEAVAGGRADVAAIDCITWAHAKTLDLPGARALRVLAWTPATPGLPLITAATTDDGTIKALRAALDGVPCDPALLLEGFEQLPPGAYDGILELEHQAITRGYPVLK